MYIVHSLLHVVIELGADINNTRIADLFVISAQGDKAN